MADQDLRSFACVGTRIMRWSIFMKPILLAIALVTCVTPAVFAQTKGRIGVGAGFNVNATTDDEVGLEKGVGVLVRLTPHPGWGAAGSFNWFKADLSNPSGSSGDFASLRTRLLMGGVSYAIGQDRLLTSFSVVVGPSFNSTQFDDRFVQSGVVAIDTNTSFALRGGVGLNYTLRPRVAVAGFGGYLINRPDIVYRDALGREFHDRWQADAVVLAVGVVYSFF